MFPQPSWQAKAVNQYTSNPPNDTTYPPLGTFPFKGRATPDVSALGEGYQVIVNGVATAVGGMPPPSLATSNTDIVVVAMVYCDGGPTNMSEALEGAYFCWWQALRLQPRPSRAWWHSSMRPQISVSIRAHRARATSRVRMRGERLEVEPTTLTVRAALHCHL